MPGKVKVRILAGRNLPVMDKSSDTSDAFVEVKLGNTTYKTEVFRRSLNPYWNSEWFRFEADDEELQDEPLQIRIMDYDTYSANDAIGKVYIDLNPLLNKDSGHVMTGWFPIYDTIHGIRGEVNCVVKVDLFSDTNRFRQSSCGVRFFYSMGVPSGYTCQAILGFLEELVVNDDPEYQWIDKIRTPRASNEARQTLFSKLSGEVQRKIGLKALDLGGNAVLGYCQCFDLEGESGIVVRGIGTACMLAKTAEQLFGHDLLRQQSYHYTHHHQPSSSSSFPKNEERYDSVFCLHFESGSCSHCYPSSMSPMSPPPPSPLPLPLPLPLAFPPAVAFLVPPSVFDTYLPFPYSYSRTSTPSPSTSKRSSPVPFGSHTISPRISSWFNKFTKSAASPSLPKKSQHNSTATLPRTSTPTKIGVSLEAEIASSFRSNASLREQQHNYHLYKTTLKRVASQPVAFSLHRQHSYHCQPLARFEPIPASPSAPPSPAPLPVLFCSESSASSSTSSHAFSIVRVSGEDTNYNHLLTTPSAAAKASESVSPPSSVPVIPPGIGPGQGPISPLGSLLMGRHSPAKDGGLHRRGSSNPDLSTTPRAGSSHSSGDGRDGAKGNGFKFTIAPESLHLLEYPFITMKQFPSGLIQHLGGAVTSRSVKLLDMINNPEEPETRDTWWIELRKEIRSHCRALGCNAVLGYSEAIYICDEVVILSVSGTAVTLYTGLNDELNTSQTEKEIKRDSDPIPSAALTPPPPSVPAAAALPSQGGIATPSASKVSPRQDSSGLRGQHVNGDPTPHPAVNCVLCHIPYHETTVPFPTSLIKCNTCKKGRVPDVLFMTIEPPLGLPLTGMGCLIQARVCRSKRDSKGEHCAKEISDSLPFLEYEVHRQLLSKIKVKGMNALFGLTVQISVGDNMLVALATGTGAFISSLPPPVPPKISSGKGVKSSKLNEIQKLIQESITRNREYYGLIQANAHQDPDDSALNGSGDTSSLIGEAKVIEAGHEDVKESSGEHMNKAREPPVEILDIDCGNKSVASCLLLEVDDTEDADIISLMIDSDIPKGYTICNTEIMPGLSAQLVCNLQTFSQVYRAKLTTTKQFGQQFDWIIQSLFVKLRRLIPCCLTNVRFRVDLPEQDMVQVTVLGSAIGLGPGFGHLSKVKGRKRTTSSTDYDFDELMFKMDDDDQRYNKAQPEPTSQFHPKEKEKAVPYHLPATEHFGIELTPGSHIPGAFTSIYLGNLDFFFIRETSSIREQGGLNGFMHSFLTEVLAIVRAHVSGLGGNAMTSLHLTQCVLFYNPHKNQAQCLINVAGDAVIIQYNAHLNFSTKPSESIVTLTEGKPSNHQNDHE